jgi:hypothetical protein
MFFFPFRGDGQTPGVRHVCLPFGSALLLSGFEVLPNRQTRHQHGYCESYQGGLHSTLLCRGGCPSLLLGNPLGVADPPLLLFLLSRLLLLPQSALVPALADYTCQNIMGQLDTPLAAALFDSYEPLVDESTQRLCSDPPRSPRHPRRPRCRGSRRS